MLIDFLKGTWLYDILEGFTNKIHKIVSQIEDCLKDIELLVILYLQPLKIFFDEYKETVNYSTKKALEEDSNPDCTLEITMLKTASMEFKASLAKLLRKKGYSYL